MDKGKLVETGTHEGILQAHPEGFYARLVREQESAEADGEQVPEASPMVETSEDLELEKAAISEQETKIN